MKTSFDIRVNTNGRGLFKACKIKSALIVALAFAVGGCWAPAIKPPISAIAKLNSILIVPVESPPLEISPDPIAARVPAYAHYRNMAIDFPLRQKLYKTPGDIVVAGLVSPGDDADEMAIQDEPLPPRRAIGSAPRWTPTLLLARQALHKLGEHKIKASLSRDYYALPMTETDRNAELSHWHDATLTWYGRDAAAADYRRHAGIDAVLELGLGSYRIFAGQMSVQVLMKLIDPQSGRVIARTRADDFTTEPVGENALNRDSEVFKQRLALMSSRLLTQGLHEFGWPL